jgi:integrase
MNDQQHNRRNDRVSSLEETARIVETELARQTERVSGTGILQVPEKPRHKKQGKRERGIFEKAVGSGVWWIRYADATGRIRREKAGSKDSAGKLYRKRKTHALEGRKLPEKLRSPRVSFASIAQDALDHSKAYKVQEAYRIDRWHMETLLRWFRDRIAEEITPQDIERKLNELAEDGRKPATVNRYRTLLSLVFSLAVRNGKLSANPVRQVKPRKENNERVRFLEPEEETKLRKEIRELGAEREAEFELALNTGMRRGEQYRLRWQDVDLRREVLTIPRSKHGEARHIQINSTARAALLILRGERDRIGYVIPSCDGPRTRDWRHWFEEVVKKAGLQNFRWHDLRHTFASRLVMARVPLRTVQVLMGHKCIETTLRYAHLAETHLREAVEQLTAEETDTRTSTEQASTSARQVAASA